MTEFLLRLEPAEQAVPLTVDLIEQAARAQGLVPRHAVRTDRGWWLQLSASSASTHGLMFPAGWQVVDQHPLLEQMSWPASGTPRAVGEVFSFALLLWPAVIGLFVLESDGWQLWAKGAVALWLGLLHLVAYRGGRGAYFGNNMAMLSACVAGFWWTHPGSWMFLWLALILIGLYAAVRGVLRDQEPLGTPTVALDAPGGRV